MADRRGITWLSRAQEKGTRRQGQLALRRRDAPARRGNRHRSNARSRAARSWLAPPDAFVSPPCRRRWAWSAASLNSTAAVGVAATELAAGGHLFQALRPLAGAANQHFRSAGPVALRPTRARGISAVAEQWLRHQKPTATLPMLVWVLSASRNDLARVRQGCRRPISVKRIAESSRGARVIGGVLEIRSMPVRRKRQLLRGCRRPPAPPPAGRGRQCPQPPAQLAKLRGVRTHRSKTPSAPARTAASASARFPFPISLAAGGPKRAPPHSAAFQPRPGQGFSLRHGGAHRGRGGDSAAPTAHRVLSSSRRPVWSCGLSARRTPVPSRAAPRAVGVAIPESRIADSGRLRSRHQRLRGHRAHRAAAGLHRLPVPHQQAQLQRWISSWNRAPAGTPRRNRGPPVAGSVGRPRGRSGLGP